MSETKARVVDELVEVCSDSVTRDAIVDLVNTHLTRSPFEKHLAEAEAPWTSGEAAPLAIQRLTMALLEAGATGVVAPGCSVCGRVQIMRNSVNGKKACNTCYDLDQRTPCSICNTMRRVYRRTPTGPICTPCHQRDPSIWRTCGVCERSRLITATQNGIDICRGCYGPTRGPCADCGRVAKRWFIAPDRGVCRYCDARRHRLCGMCGEVKSIQQRATATTPDICVNCYRAPDAVCAKCGETRTRAKKLTGGKFLCKSCAPKKFTPRECSGCGQVRRIFKVDNGADICGTCYARDRTIICHQCGQQGTPHDANTCKACSLKRRVDALVGTPNPESPLGILVNAIVTSPNPRALIEWLRYSPSSQLLARVAANDAELSHAALDDIDEPYTHHLRARLIDAGALPDQPKHISDFERWLNRKLPHDSSIPNASLIRAFATWEVLPRLRVHTDVGSATSAHDYNARTRVSEAFRLVTWLDKQGVSLDDLDQHLLDIYLVGNTTTAYQVRSFISWCGKRNAVDRRLSIPELPTGRPVVPSASDEREAALAQLFGDDSINLRDRVAGLLMILYAQPIARLSVLTTDAIETVEAETTIRFGSTPVLLPPRLAGLVDTLIATPSTAPIAATRQSRWLFPGRQPGQHITAGRLRAALKQLGIANLSTRSGAMIDLASAVPSPIIAELLGYHPGTTQRWARVAQGGWTSYIGDRIDEQCPPE